MGHRPFLLLQVLAMLVFSQSLAVSGHSHRPAYHLSSPVSRIVASTGIATDAVGILAAGDDLVPGRMAPGKMGDPGTWDVLATSDAGRICTTLTTDSCGIRWPRLNDNTRDFWFSDDEPIKLGMQPGTPSAAHMCTAETMRPGCRMGSRGSY